MTDRKIAFLGLGVMGSAMAANLVKRGFAVKGWNRTKNRPSIATFLDAGGIIAPSLQVAVQDADVIWLCLGDVPDVKEVILGHGGVVEYAKPGALIVDSSTIGSDATKQIGRALSDRSLRFLDAPVSGGDVGAKKCHAHIHGRRRSAGFCRMSAFICSDGQNHSPMRCGR